MTFTGETASGWQQATFATPVSINANTTYVASYFAPAGHTALDARYLYPNPSPRPDTVQPGRQPSPARAAQHQRGRQRPGPKASTTSTFPTDSHNAPNYWVDVLFNVNTGAATVPDAPTAVTATPGNASAVVSWSAPTDGGSAITGYTVTPYIGATAQTPTGPSPGPRRPPAPP